MAPSPRNLLRGDLSGRWKIVAVMVAAMAVLLSGCRTVEESELDGWQNYTAAMDSIIDSCLRPQTATWRMGTESGNARVPKTAAGTSVTIALWEPPTDTVWIELEKGAVRYARGAFVFEGSTRLKPVRQELDTVAAGIFRRIHPRTDCGAFDSALAQALVDGDNLVKQSGFPTKHPQGIDTASVFRQAMLIMVGKGIPLAAIARNWALGVDTLQIHTRIRVLCELGAVTDTSRIFPPYPVKVLSSITLDTILVQGGEAKRLYGAFASRDGLVSLEVKILQNGQEVTNLFAISDSASLRDRPKSLALAGAVRIGALVGAAPGSYRLQVSARDDSGRAVVSTMDFKVVAAPDRDGPNISIVAPVAGAILSADQDSVTVDARVSDPSGIDSVWINGLAMAKNNDSWRLSGLAVPATDSGTWILVRARDRAGNSSVASVKVFRRPAIAVVPQPQGGSRTSILSPASGQYVPFDTSLVHVVWKVVRPGSTSVRVLFNGLSAIGTSDSTWAADVPVPPTGARFLVRLEAIDAEGDTLFDSVAVVRAKDPVPPVLRRVAGSRGVGVDSVQVFVSWSVSDNHKLATVSVNGRPVTGVEGIYGDRIALVEGANLVRIAATDSTGNAAVDSVVVVRGAKDTTRPDLRRVIGTGDRTVLADSSAVVLAWNASDSFLASVDIGGVVVAGSQGVFGRLVPLSPGRNIVHVHAVDSTGNVTTDSVVIVRLEKDTLKPVVVRLAGTLDRVVRYDSSKVRTGWRVMDAGLRSVSIAGAVVAGVSGRYESEISLAVGWNIVRMAAVDSTGNVTTDSVVIQRLARDTIAPNLVRFAGTADRTVAPDTVTVSVGWTVSDASLKNVSLGSGSVDGASGAYSASIALHVGRNVVRLRAVDSAGNLSTDSVVIVRLARDSLKPVLVRSTVTNDRKVRFDTTAALVSWRVSDAALRSVSIGGNVVTGYAGAYSVNLGLSVGRNVVVVVAVDSAGNVATDSIVIERLEKDVSGPVLVRLPGTENRVLRFDSLSTTVSWSVTDAALRSVVIGGDSVIGAGGVYSKSISVLGSSQSVVIVATDSFGNVSRDSVELKKGIDSLPPVLARIPGTADATVAAEVDHFAVQWSAIDDGVLQSVLINDVEAIADGSLFFLDVPLEHGINDIVIVASDGAGHSSTDTIRVNRL